MRLAQFMFARVLAARAIVTVGCRDVRRCFHNDVARPSVNHSVMFIGDSRVRDNYYAFIHAVDDTKERQRKNLKINMRFDDRQLNFSVVRRRLASIARSR